MTVHEVVVRLEGDRKRQAVPAGYAEPLGHAVGGVVRQSDGADLAGFHESVEGRGGLLQGRRGIVEMRVVQVDPVGSQTQQRLVGRRGNRGGGEALVLGVLAHLRGDEHTVASPGCRQPAAEDDLRFAAGMAGRPGGVHVGGVDEGSSGVHEGVEHGPAVVLGTRPSEGVASEDEGEEIGGRSVGEAERRPVRGVGGIGWGVGGVYRRRCHDGASFGCIRGRWDRAWDVVAGVHAPDSSILAPAKEGDAGFRFGRRAGIRFRATHPRYGVRMPSCSGGASPLRIRDGRSPAGAPPVAYSDAERNRQPLAMVVPALAPADRSSISVISSTGTTAGFLVPFSSATFTCAS